MLTALLLFGMFFGAGNLIFPPMLGAMSGEQFVGAISGFVLSGVGIAIITLVIGLMNPKGYYHDISTTISPKFAFIFLIILYLSIGPFFAIPRTATVAFNMGIAPMLPVDAQHEGVVFNVARLIYTGSYFLCGYVIAITPSKILDRIGKVMTPIFAMMILMLVVLGAIKYSSNTSSHAIASYSAHVAFGTGFIEGYNTLDALAAVAFSLVAIKTLTSFGFSSKKEYMATIWSVGLLVAMGFSIFYIGLGFLGNRFPIPNDMIKSNVDIGSYVISQATQDLFGSSAQLLLAIMVAVTCFTTTVGLIVAVSEFFVSKFNKVSYRTFAIIFTLIGFVIANLGLSTIVAFSIPVLMILYPVTMTLATIILIQRFCPMSKIGIVGTTSIVMMVAIMDVMGDTFNINVVNMVIDKMPFGIIGMAWLLPALIGIVIACCLPNRVKLAMIDISDN